MKINPLINITGKTFFFLCLLLLIINYVSTIKISFHHYFFQFWGTYIISFLILIFTSKHKVYFFIIGILTIVFSIYHIINSDHQIGIRKKNINSPYEIKAYPNKYKIVEKHFFLEKVIAEKKSRIFFNSYSKIGLIYPFEFDIKLLHITKNKITIEIKTDRNGNTVDTLRKEEFFSFDY